jgi:uncharacterized protein (TIGR02145 family)
MDSQTITQTINVLVGPGVPNTGIGPTQSSPLLPLAIGTTLTLLIASLLTWYFLVHRSRNSHSHPISQLISKLGSRGFSIVVLLALVATLFTTNPPIASAAPSLSLGTDQNTIHITVPQGGGTATATTTLISGTANTDGYTLTATLTEPEPGIGIKLKGGDVTTDTSLNPGDAPLTLKATDAASSNDTTDVTLTFAIDGSVTPGQKELKLNYAVADNEAEGEAGSTLQAFTSSDCSALPIYTGTNEEAVITLTDTRGDNQTYQVAKLADNNCWMLENLKLGSTTGTLTLTPSDSDVASNFTLPQLTTTGTTDPDNPGAYGPVTGDTGEGETNYGYLYNWPAVTAGESRTSHTETDGDAPYSICPSGWRLPTVGFSYDEETETATASGDYSNLDIAFGGTGQYADSGANIAKWQHDGPFKGTFAGYWDEGFVLQGDYALLWSRSAFPDLVDLADLAYFNAGEVGPGHFAPRGYGLAVRCLLQ